MKIAGEHAIRTAPAAVLGNQAKATPCVPGGASSTMVIISELGKSLGKQESAGIGTRESIADIMSGVNLRHIRYPELVSVATRLREAGHLEEKDYLDFIGPSPEYSMLDGSRNPDWAMPMDIIGRHEMNLEFMISSGLEQRFIDFEKHLLDLYRKFEA